MRALPLLLVSALLLTACGERTDVTLNGHGPRTTALENGAAADAIIGQLSERGVTSARTDAGSFGSPVGVAVGMGGKQLFVADAANKRVLGWADTTLLKDPSNNGTDASLVLNQEDMFTSDFRNIPKDAGDLNPAHIDQRLTPIGVAVDQGQRLYVYDGVSVIVFEDPFTTDVVADYELVGEPANIRSVRALGHGKVAVVGLSAIVFYEQGSPDPYAQSTLASPCAGQTVDVARTTDTSSVLYVACSGPLLCSNGTDTLCGQVFVYAVDLANGLPARQTSGGPPVGCLAYNDLTAISSIDTTSQQLIISDGGGNRIFLWDGVDAHANGILSTPPTCAGTARLPAAAPTSNIYGQPNASSTAPNYYSSTESRIWEGGLSLPGHVAIDPDDNRMWVVDAGNNRVLGFGTVSGGSPERSAKVVLGQLDATHALANRLEPSALSLPMGVALGPDTASPGLRAAVVDYGTHRVLLFNNINSYETGGDPSLVLGQQDARSYLDQGITPATMSLSSLSHPTYAAIAPNGAVYVTDTGNARVLAYDSITTANRPAATRVFGASSTGTTGGVYGLLGPVVATTTHLFVAAGNRVFMWETSTPRVKPIRVFGQILTPGDSPISDDIDNTANRGMSIARADTLSNVTGLAIDGDGTLWVADSDNRRVLWFDSPTASDATGATTADGVVGQVDFASTYAYGSPAGTVSRYGFSAVSGIAAAADGTLWVADIADSRILVFFDPKTPDAEHHMTAANLVLGQSGFEQAGANNTLNGVNARTLSGPKNIAVDTTGRTLLVSDAGNYRVLRTIDNRPPLVIGAGTFEVVAGDTGSVILTVSDPDNDNVTTTLVDPVPMGATLANNTVRYAAPADAPAGSTARVVLAATDDGPRAQSTTASVIFEVVARSSQIPGGTPPAARPALEPQGCSCAGAETSLLTLLALLPLGARRRRR